MNGLVIRATLAFLALPGVVAFAIPLLVFERTWPPADWAWTGAAVLAVGLVILGLTVRDFYLLGRGTLAPWAPPAQLVVAGLYRFSRNPMYVGVLCIVLGWAILFRSVPLALYAVTLFVVFHFRVVRGEEPWLARTHGAAWQTYVDTVPRWVGRRRTRGRAS